MTGATRVETFRIGREQNSGCILERRQFARERYGVQDYREIADYPVTVVGKVQGAAFAARLKQALFDLPPDPYNGVSCFEPGIAFRVWKGKQSVVMLVCFACGHQVVMTKDARGRIIHQVDVANSPLMLSVAVDAFPQDQDLQALKREAAIPRPAPRPRPVLQEDPDASSYNTLIRAARDDNFPKFQEALAQLTDINSSNQSVETAMIYALRNGDQAMVSALLDKGLPADGEGIWHGQALLVACGTGQKEIAQLLIRRGANVNTRNHSGQTAMMHAAEGGDVGIMRLLISHGATFEDADDEGETALTEAAARGHPEAAQFLLDHGADINAHTKDGETALTKAAAQGHAALVRLLLNKGAAVDARNNQGETALIEAARKADTAVVSLLLAHGADIQAHDTQGLTALMAAVQGAEHPDCAQLLMERGAGINSADQNGDTPLLWAVSNGAKAVPVTRLLLTHGADVDSRDKDGVTPLLRATGCVPIMQILLGAGAAVNTPDEDDDTPLMWAADQNDLPSVRLLLQHRADVHHRDRYGDTAMTLAQKDHAAKALPALRTASRLANGRS